MAVEPYTAAAFIVSVSALLVAGAVAWAARETVRYVRETRDAAETALRTLHGEEGVEDGLVHDVREHRQALLHAGIYPVEARGGDDARH